MTQRQRYLPPVLQNLPFPVIGSPLFIISNPKLVIAQCKAGVVGSMPALNARPASQLDEWLAEITEALAAHDKANPDNKAAPFAINQIVHKSNDRLEHDMQLCAKYKVPVIITSLGARTDVNEAIHSYGGVVLHDIINNHFARKAIEKGADGLIAVAAGAGGHAGVKSPFALIQDLSAIGINERGEAVTVWQSHAQDGSGSGVFGQRYDKAGSAQGTEFRANSQVTGDQSLPDVAVDASGRFAVVWRSPNRINGQRFDSTGALLGAELTISPFGVVSSPEVGSSKRRSLARSFR